MRLVLLVTLLLLPIPTASEALELCAKADLRGPDPTAPRNNSPIKLREQCKSPKEVSIGSTADLAKVQANEAAIANKADQSEVDANAAAIGQNVTAIEGKADTSLIPTGVSLSACEWIDRLVVTGPAENLCPSGKVAVGTRDEGVQINGQHRHFTPSGWSYLGSGYMSGIDTDSPITTRTYCCSLVFQ